MKEKKDLENKLNKININDVKHDVSGHSNLDDVKIDHYHGEHHFDKFGHHDDVNDTDFLLSNTIKFTSRSNLIFRIVLSSIILAISIAGTTIDELSESLLSIPSPAGMISLRFIDITIITISISSIGLVFSGFIGFIMPLLHWAIHQDHSIINSLFECVAYLLLVIYFWIIYYAIFKNSIFHKETNKKKLVTKKSLSGFFYVLGGSFIFTFFVVLGLYVTYKTGMENNNHDDSDDDARWINIVGNKKALFAVIGIFYGLESIRIIITYSLFLFIEPTILKLNHRYR